MIQKRQWVFLRDVFVLAFTAIGGPHLHIPLFLKKLVEQRNYISEEEFIELNALCQVLPGPTTTQTLTAIGFKLGGPTLAYFTLFIWVFPSMLLMTIAALLVQYFAGVTELSRMVRYVEPMAVAFVAYAGWVIASKVIHSKTSLIILVISGVLGFFFRSPYVAPVLIVVGGISTVFKYKRFKEEAYQPIQVKWANFLLFVGVLVLGGVLGIVMNVGPISMFEHFYRNGSMIFGGGQVLVPLLYNEFVAFKHYLTAQEFLTGYALVQVMPGPVFSIAAYIGALCLRGEGIWMQLAGSFAATAGIFLPGTFLIFFIYRIWGSLKQYRQVKASLEGINAVSAGLVIAAALSLFEPVHANVLSYIIMLLTFLALLSERIAAPLIIFSCFIAGIFF